MQYSFGAAKKLYEKHQHPRILCGEGDIAALRRKVGQGWAKKIMVALRDHVRPLVEGTGPAEELQSIFSGGTRAQKHPIGGRLLPALSEMALVGVLDEDRETIDAVRRLLVAIPIAEAGAERDRLRVGYGSLHTVHQAYDFIANHMTEPERAAYTQWAVGSSIRESLAFVRKYHYLRCAGMNIPMVGVLTALHGLLAVEGDPGVPDLSAEKEELVRYFEAALFCSLGREGYPHEDIGYGTLMVARAAPLVEALRRAGIYDAYRLCPRYLKFGRSMLHMVQPWGRFLSNTGDYGADFGPRSPIFPRLAAATRDPALLWLHGQISYPVASAGPNDFRNIRVHWPEVDLAKGFQVPVDIYSLLTVGDLKKPVHPSKTKTPTHYVDPDRGLASFRSNWKADATFVLFDGAHRCAAAQGHAHDSGGHFSLSALGEYFAIDTGRYNIMQEQHNVVLVDGKSGHDTGGTWRASWYQSLMTGFKPGAFVDSAAVDASQMSDCYWARRTLGLVKDPTNARVPAYVWTVEDVNKDNDYHEFWWTLNVNPNHKIEISDDRATGTGCDHGNHLDVFIGMPYPKAYPRPSTLELFQHEQLSANADVGSNDMHTVQKRYNEMVGNEAYGPSFVRPRLVAKVGSYAGRFMSLLIPRRKGAPMPRVERLDSLDNTLAMRVNFGDVEDTLIWAYEHHLLEAGGVRGRGNWCVVRRSRRSGRVLAHAIAEGTKLEVDGKRIEL